MCIYLSRFFSDTWNGLDREKGRQLIIVWNNSCKGGLVISICTTGDNEKKSQELGIQNGNKTIQNT